MAERHKIESLREFLKRHLPVMRDVGGRGSDLKLPAFQLSSREYLRFAERELESQTIETRINCVAHLKRAADCQLDTFLFAYNLYDMAKRANLSFEQKLAFTRDVGLFSSRSLVRFNQLRNRIEHDYHAPDIADLEVFYDLVQALVAVLEAAMLLLANNKVTEYEITAEGVHTDRYRIGVFSIEYDRVQPAILTEWKVGSDEQTLRVTPAERPDFTFFFLAFVLLARRPCFGSESFAVETLEKFSE